jgi:hypothetical protein
MTAGPQFPSGSNDYPEQSQASIALVLGILGIVLVGIVAPLAWVTGNNELAAIDGGRRPPDSRSTANRGRLLGIVGTVVVASAVLLFVFTLVGIIEVS